MKLARFRREPLPGQDGKLHKQRWMQSSGMSYKETF